jgi:hypothetical protein
MRCPWSAQTAQPRVKTDRKSALVSIDPRLEISSSCASQAENASSILVARSWLDFVATTHEVVENIAVGFRHYSPLCAPIRQFLLSHDRA